METTSRVATVEHKLDRGLPASIDAEKTILGAILLDNHACNEAAEAIGADDFYLDAHRRIFGRMLDLSERGQAIDIITLTEELSRKKEVEAVGGVAYISSLIDGVPHQPSIEQYVKIVKDKAILRRLIETSTGIITEAYDGHSTANDLLDSAEAKIFQISQQRGNEGFTRIKEMGTDGTMTSGILRGIEDGWFTGEIAEAAFVYQRALEKGDKKVVGVNSRVEGVGENLEILRISGDVETQQNALLARRRAARDGVEVKNRLADLVEAARGSANMIPAMLAACRAEATLGEICDVLRAEWGTYTEPARI